jgi:hypothetical protein
MARTSVLDSTLRLVELRRRERRFAIDVEAAHK